MKKAQFTILIALISNSCAFSPGMHMNVTEGKSNVEVPVLASGEYVTAKLPISPITANLILNQNVARRRSVETRKQLRITPDYRYRIGPGDVLSITVWEHPEIASPELDIPIRAVDKSSSTKNSGHLVGEDGKLFFPYVGELKVVGKTVDQVRRILTNRLAVYIQNVQLDVRVVAYRSQKAYVVGEVKKPSTQHLTDVPLTVVEAISRAGGVTLEADIENATLARGDQVFKLDLPSFYEKGDVSQNMLLRDGDVLNIPDDSYNRIFVLGEVNQPLSQKMTRGRKTLAEALGDAGGVNPMTSDPSRVYVIRTGQPKPEIFHLDAKSPDAMVLADRFELLPRDVVYVDSALLSRWNRVITQILSPTRTWIYPGIDTR